MSEIHVVAHSSDWGKVATATFQNLTAKSPTPPPTPTTQTTATAPTAVYVLGYVQSVHLSTRTLGITPVEGQATSVTLAEGGSTSYAGQGISLTEIRPGDLIEAGGRLLNQDQLLADQVRVLTRGSAEPTPTVTPTRAVLVWKGEYYDNLTFSGSPALVRSDPVIDFQWQGAGPAEGLPVDGFSVRWIGTWPFQEGNYRFYTQVDDGVRLALDDHWIIDRWHESTGALYTADAYLSTNPHVVRVEYFEARDSAQAKVWWEYRGPEAKQNYPDWQAEYFGNASLGGAPFVVVNERTLAFDWGAGAPAAGLPTDGFSARWTRTTNLEEGTYIFHARVDDGFRMWVDDGLLFDRWLDTAVQSYSAERYLSKGSHRLRVEYYENTGEAVVSLEWELLPATPTPTPPLPTPTATLTATPAPTPTWTATPEPSPTSGPTPAAGSASTFTTFLPFTCSPSGQRAPSRGSTGRRKGGPAPD
jgi:hypothetical protein